MVYYDYEDIFYQSERARKAMVRDSIKREKRQTALEASESWKLQKEQDATRKQAKKAKQQAKVDKLKTKFEEHAKARQETLSAYDFEQWKQAELDAIKALEDKHELYWALTEINQKARAERREALIRSRYTRSKSRGNVFSILRPDGSEEVVYNADTLGLLADGTYEEEYGIEDMRQYIKGRQDGRKHSLHDIGIGAAVGLGSALAWGYFWDIFYAPTFPAGAIAVIGFIPLKIQSPSEVLIESLWSPAYRDGYERSARARKIWAFAVGAAGGLAIGTAIVVTTSPQFQ